MHRPVVAFLAFSWVACGVGSFEEDTGDATFDAAQTDEASLTSSKVIAVDADTYVRSGTHANRNFGTSPSLVVDADATGDRTEAFIRFKLAPLAGRITRARFRCYVSNGSANAFDVFSASDFDEGTVTYNTRPTMNGSALATVTSAGQGAFVQVDVTALAQRNATFVIALRPRSGDGLTCLSKESASNKPSLVVTVESAKPRILVPVAGAVVTGSSALGAIVDGVTAPSEVARLDFILDGATTLGPAVAYLGWNLGFESTHFSNGSHTLVARATLTSGAIVDSAPVTFSIANDPSVKVFIAAPAAGATVSGSSAVLSASVAGLADIARVEFSIDGTAPIGPAPSTIYGHVATFDSTRLTNAVHSVVARAFDSKGNVTTSPSVSFFVSNAPVTETWGDHMGTSIWGDRANFDKTKALGLKWVRFGWEQGWGAFDHSLITYAHSIGLKVLWVCQKSPHTYSGLDADVQSFAKYCAGAVDDGVEAIEIGNEWNHLPFYSFNGGVPDSTYVSQAKYFDATTAAIRAKSSTVTIISAGWSPESTPNSPKEAMAKSLDHAPIFKAKGSAIAHHPYAYTCDSPLRCDWANHPEWNAFLQTGQVYQAAKARGFDKPVWLTEIGGPSGNGVNPWNSTPYTLASQAQLFRDYLTGIAQLRSQGVPVGVIFWHTAQDGQSATSTLEETFGLYDKNWTLKPAGQVIKDQSAKPW